ncbi:hypothetical protein [Streptomyces sp. WM6378]|uniref:hypothetical protein n=1 Tax=Streptomyces sp. WM6378 TaxID=1415557 RepID=UPI002D21DFAF|nr:hypothetical protein [Streptomyces sp. WM6378]
MSTSDQEQAVDATPEAGGASRAAEATVPNQAPNRPTAERASQRRGGEAEGADRDAERAEAGGAPEAAEGAGRAGIPKPAQAPEAAGSEARGASGRAEQPAHSEEARSHQLAYSAEELESPEPSEGAADEAERQGMAPRQARRIRMVAAGVLMAAMGVILVVRLATRSSVLVVGVYGLALILCGVVIELSRNGRTRLGSWLLVVGLAAALGMDWFVLP